MASLKEIMNVDEDEVDRHPVSLKSPPQPLEPGPTPPTGPESSLPASRFNLGRDHPLAPPLRHHRSPTLPYPHPPRVGSSPSSSAYSAAGEAHSRYSNASGDPMDSPRSQSYLSDPSSASESAMGRPNMPGGQQSDPNVKLTPITGRVSRAKKGVPVHICDMCKPPKNFTRAEHLRRHQKSHAQPELKCDWPGCTKAFHREDLLRRHETRHKEDQEAASSSASTNPAINNPYGSPVMQGGIMPLTPGYNKASTRHHSSSSTSPNPGRYNAAPNATRGQGSEYSYSHATRNPNAGTTGRNTAHLAWTSSAGPTPTVYSTGPINQQGGHLDQQSGGSQWVRMPLSSPSGMSTDYQSTSYTYGGSSATLYGTAPLAESGMLPIGAYQDDTSLYGPRDPPNSTVRSLSPRMAVPRSSETLVITPAALPSHRVDGTALGGWQPGDPDYYKHEDLAPKILSGEVEANVEKYVQLFWERSAPTLALVHQPSFTEALQTTEHGKILKYAMAAIGAHYLNNEEDRVNGSQLHAFASYHAKQCINAQTVSTEIMQAVCLCEHLNRFRGRRQGAHIASSHFNEVFQMLNAPETIHAKIPQDGNVQERWLEWVKLESRRRILAACFFLDVHAAYWQEQPVSAIKGLDCSSPSTLPIPLPGESAQLWNAQNAQDWERMLTYSGYKVKTLANVSPFDATRKELWTYSLFHRGILLAGFALYLPRRISVERVHLLKSFADIEPSAKQFATLFGESGTANAYLALYHTPLRCLLSVSGDTWVFNQKVSDPMKFKDNRKHLVDWRRSCSAHVAMSHAAKTLKYYLDAIMRYTDDGKLRATLSWNDTCDWWGFYTCTLIFWAYGSMCPEGQGTSDDNDSGGEEDEDDEDCIMEDAQDQSYTAALEYVEKTAKLGPEKIASLDDWRQAWQMVPLARLVLAQDCLGGRNILLADAVNVLTKLEGRR